MASMIEQPLPAPYLAQTDAPNLLATTLAPDEWVGCMGNWEPIQNIVFQFAYVFLVISFLIPPSSLTATLVMHVFLVLGFICYAVWAFLYECALDIFIWNTLFAFMNLCHAIYIAIKIRPVKLHTDSIELYNSVFKPFRIPKHVYNDLSALGKIQSLKIGENYAKEGKTPCQRLSILVSGKVKVFCKGEFLHAIREKEFLDSPEWDSFKNGQECDYFQITLTATNYCHFMSWNRNDLMDYLEKEPYTKKVFENLVGADITKKMFLLTEKHLNVHGSRSDIRLPSSSREVSTHHDLKGHLISGPMGACGIGIPSVGVIKT